MKLVPAIFRFIARNAHIFQWGSAVFALVLALYLFCVIPIQHQKFESFAWYDTAFVVWQIARGQQADFYGQEYNALFQFSRLALHICFLGVFVAIIIACFRAVTRWAIKHWFCGHIIIFGIGEKGFTLAKELLKRNLTVIAIDKNAGNSHLNHIEHRGGFILVGDATDVKFIKTLGLHRAAGFYAMTGDDTINIESALRIKEFFRDHKISLWSRSLNFLCGFKPEEFSARIQVHNSILRRLAWEENVLNRQGEIAHEMAGPLSRSAIEKESPNLWACYPFSAYDQAAKIIVEEHSPDIAVEEKTKKYHVVIVGFGWFGERVALQVIRTCQTQKSKGQKPVIYIIDKNAEENRERFYQRYPAVDSDPKIANDPRYGTYAPLAEMHFIQGDIQRMNEAAIKEAFSKIGKSSIDQCSVIYICLADEMIGTEAAMSLARMTRDSGTRVVLSLPDTERLSNEMQSAFKPYNISMFFPLSESCALHPGENHLGEHVDKMGKEVLRVYSGAVGVEESWAKSPEWGRESSRQSASHVFFKLRWAGLTSEQIKTVGPDEIVEICKTKLESLAEIEHDRWTAERLLDGWTYCDVRNDAKRQHDNIKPLARLDDKIKEIDIAINTTIPDIVRIWQEAKKTKKN